MHAMRTVRVARTLMPQQGQMYLRVLDVLGGLPVISMPPLGVPVFPMKKPEPSFRFIRMSVSPFSITKSRSSSVGAVRDHPYLSLWLTVKALCSAASLKRLLWYVCNLEYRSRSCNSEPFRGAG